MEPLRRLAGAGVIMDCQIVCCPGYNDCDELSRTMEDLALLHPAVNSVSIVPVGLTMHRKGLAQLTLFNAPMAAETIDRVEKFAAKCLETRGSRIFFCSDELYLKAGRPVPSDEYYEEYSQLENGVGMLRLLETEFMDALENTKPDAGRQFPFAIATGVSAAPLINKLLQTAAQKCGKIIGKVYAIQNDFFGHSIDVAGLITGGDLTAQLMGQNLGKRVLIPHTMLRHGEGVFLDDITLKEAEAAIGVPIMPVGTTGGELLAAMLGI
jgi:NifB/MoaA-like Fe-S oxidoreductase